jgi:hypothetical protein
MSAARESRDREEPVVLHLKSARFLKALILACVVIEVLLVFLDYKVNYARGSSFGEIRRLFNTTREDGLPSFFGVTQVTLFALTLWLVWFVERTRRRAVWRPLGWLVLAVGISYMAVDDGSRLHERVGSAVRETAERRDTADDAGGTGLMGFPSYSWQVVYGPFFAALGIFILVYLWGQLGRRRAPLLLLAMALNATAVGMDFVEGLDEDHPLNVYSRLASSWDIEDYTQEHFSETGFETLVHFSKSVEEFLEMLATTILWALCLEFLMRRTPELRFRFGPSRP